MRKAMIYGAGISGKSVDELLKKMKWETVLVDDKNGISSTDAVSYLEEVELFIKSPGIPYNTLVKEVMKRNIKVVDEIELAYEYMKKNSKTKIIAVTGTNGKTTTVSKLSELLNTAGIKSIAAGNIGVPFSKVVLDGEKYEYIVLELSSYQLENIYNFKADIAMVINLAPDHLDRYNGESEYYNTKMKIGINQTSEDKFIFNNDDDEIEARISMIECEKINLSLEKKADIYVEDEELFFKNELVTKTTNFSLKGKHNLQNILFIVGVAKLIKIPNEIIIEFLENTKNLEHRMEEFFSYQKFGKNIKFINDSKGTNLESTIKAIGAFNKPILICGGANKNLDLTPLLKVIKTDVKEVYLIGELASKIEKELKIIGYEEKNIYNVSTLEKGIEKLYNNIILNRESVKLTVILSPGTSSFDQFKNFEVRGKEFKRLVEKYFRV